ncbi:MAG: PEP-CTERM sorting domain-containing protein [Armatimonadia bacterium]|nr:PEP-CTERM sorting domain-containing protein [Armatimonadia bacterium]
MDVGRWAEVRVVSARKTVLLCGALILVALPATADLEYYLDPGLGFQGTTRSASGFIPPDTMGAVGRDHIVELINGRYRVYDKTDGTTVRNRSLNQFWLDAGVTPAGSFAFDPRVVYDPFSERYFASSVDNAGGANNLLFAVSNSDDPLDGWSAALIDSDSDDTHWADFETLGFNADGVYVAANMFPISSGSNRTAVLAIEKAPLLGATPTFSGAIWQDLSLSSTGFAMQPVLDYDNTGLPYDLIGVVSGNTLSVSTISGDLSSSPTLTTGAQSVTTVTVSDPPDADQPNDVQDLETNDIRISSNVILINGSYWGTQAVTRNGRSAIRWFEIDQSTYTVVQEGFIEDSVLDLYYPSIAVSEDGFAAIGCSGSSASQFASAYVVHGEMQAGVMEFGDPVLIEAGSATYRRLDSRNRNRWGDYSATVIDPYNPRVFWTFQEYAHSQNEWATWIQRMDTERIPEPGTMALVGLGLAGLGWLRRRRKR